MGSPVRFGPGARSEPQDVPGGSGTGRREVPFGPEVSWPYGFRPLDSESRQVLESAYGTGPSVYQPSAMDDYGDPGYSDPSYDGPSYGSPSYGGPSYPGGSGGSRGLGDGRRYPGSLPGYHVPDAPRVPDPPRSGYQSPGYQTPSSGYQAPSSGGDIWPVTGAQEALPDTGPQPAADARRGSSRPGQAGYPEQRYDSPRLDDRALDDPRPSRSADPRLEGMTYGELRYDDSDQAPSGEHLDDESWFQELRRSAPAYPQNPAPSRGPASGPQRRMDPPGPSGPAFGSSPGGYPQAAERPGGTPGFGQPRWDGKDRPQMSAGRPAGRGPQLPQGSPAPAPGSTAPGSTASGSAAPGSAAPGSGFLSAPAASVGLLTPPGGTRVDALRDGGTLAAPKAAPPAPPVSATPAVSATRASQVLAAPDAAGPRPAAVRPGHGLDGPAITSSWPAQPETDDLESYDDFWRDDADEEYTGLFGDREAEFKRAAAKQAAAAKRQTGRRRGRSSDHRLWVGLIVILVVAVGGLAFIVKSEFLKSPSGPAHTMSVPDKIGSYARTVDLERSANLGGLQQKIVAMSSGQASDVKSAVYESGNSAAGNNAQIIMFVGGHLANADSAASIASFIQQNKGAKVVSAGPLGGKAACVQGGTGAEPAAMCVFFDSDSFGALVSPTMSPAALAKQMLTVRSSVEQVAGN